MVDVTGGKPRATSVGKVISVPDPTIELIAPAPNPARPINAMWEANTSPHTTPSGYRVRRCVRYLTRLRLNAFRVVAY